MGTAALGLVGGVWRRALDLVFPPRCVGCGRFGAFFCDPCRAAMKPAAPPRCALCWMPVLPARPGSPVEGPVLPARPGSPAEGPGASGPCARCRREPFAFAAARAAFIYDGPAREAVHALKYRGLSALAPLMAPPMADVVGEWRPPVGCIVPVPIAGPRRRLRGYNQSELLARELSRLSGLPAASAALVRRRSAPPQARAADEAARRQNVAGAFAAGQRPVPGGVLLIDDVLTSGATLDACAAALRRAGAGPVFALTFARED